MQLIKTQTFTQYFCSNSVNPNAIKTTTIITRKMLANTLRTCRSSGRWHINRHDDGGYVLSNKTTSWVFTVEPNF